MQQVHMNQPDLFVLVGNQFGHCSASKRLDGKLHSVSVSAKHEIDPSSSSVDRKNYLGLRAGIFVRL